MYFIIITYPKPDWSDIIRSQFDENCKRCIDRFTWKTIVEVQGDPVISVVFTGVTVLCQWPCWWWFLSSFKWSLEYFLGPAVCCWWVECCCYDCPLHGDGCAKLFSGIISLSEDSLQCFKCSHQHERHSGWKEFSGLDLKNMPSDLLGMCIASS